MADANPMYVLDAGDDLLKELACILLLQPFSLDDVIEELTTTRVLHDQKQLLRGLNYFIELNHIGVSHYLQNVNLARHTLHIGLVLDLVLLEYFYGYFLACKDMCAQAHLAKSALPKGPAFRERRLKKEGKVSYLRCSGLSTDCFAAFNR